MVMVDTGKKITMYDIARELKVSQPVVSAVLNNNFKNIKVSIKTKERILQLAQESNYYVNASARALSSRKTGNIGFILSDNICDGWANTTFSQILNGVEHVCREYGYNITICRYNLSNLDSFIFPEQIGRRCVDGILFTGYVSAEVLMKFRSFNIPGVCIGDNLGVSDIMPVVACDFVDGVFQAIEKLSSLGSRRVILCSQQTPREQDIINQLADRLRASHIPINVDYYQPDSYLGNYNDAAALFEYWQSASPSQRASSIIATDQVLVSLLPILHKNNIVCPDELSMVSTCDSTLCRYGLLSLSCISYDLEQQGRIAAEMLLRHLNGNAPLTLDMSRTEACSLTLRASTASGTTKLGQE